MAMSRLICSLGLALLADARLIMHHEARNAGGLGAPELCHFEVFGKGIQEAVSASNIAFSSNGVFVVNDQSSRVLVFQSDKITENGEKYCHEQAEVKCSNNVGGGQQTLAADASMLDQAHALNLRGASLDIAKTSTETVDVSSANHSCAATQCTADDFPGLSYIRSMLGGSFVARSGKVSRVASIGLGAGSIPLWFSRNMPDVEIDTIDVNPNVIKAAPCFGVNESPKLKLVEKDGRKYLEEQPDGAFDVIFVDAFDDKDYVPTCLRTVEFFKTVRAKLSRGGVLAMNSWKRELNNVYGSLKQAFSDAGSSVNIGVSPGLGNLVVMAVAPGGPAGGEATSAPAVTGVAADTANGWNIEASFDAPGPGSEYRNVDSSTAPVTDADVCSAYAR